MDFPVLSPPAANASAQVRHRPAELEDFLNLRIYHPLAARLARALVPTGISPNAVSVAGGLLIVAAGLAYTLLAYPLAVVAGLTLHLSWHVVDGADGDLARMTGRSSPTGELVDGACDYLGHVFLYVALTIVLAESLGGWVWLPAVAAGASHIAQTNNAESRKRSYLWWAYGVPWLKQAQGRGGEMFTQDNWFMRACGPVARIYLSLAGATNRDAHLVEAALAAGAYDPVLQERLRAEVRREAPSLLAFVNWLGANPRAILLGLAMALGSVLWFFAAEIVLLNAVLLASMAAQGRANRRLAKRLAALVEAG